MKIAFVIGHHKNAKGAYSEHLKVSEFDFYCEVIKHLGNVSVFYHDENIRGYNSRMKATTDKINKFPFDLVIELHFNRFEDSSAKGCETLFYHSSVKGKKYAQLFSNVVNELTDIELRRRNGLKPLYKGDRGYGFVSMTKAPTILIEPFFGSNKEDCEKIQGTRNVANIIREFLNRL